MVDLVLNRTNQLRIFNEQAVHSIPFGAIQLTLNKFLYNMNTILLRIAILICTISIFTNLSAQPPNDECAGAIPYPGDLVTSTCVTGFDFSQYTDSGLSPSATCDGGDATAWFTFTAPVISVAGNPITLEWDAGINCDIGIEVYENDCGTPVPSSCINNVEGLLTNLIEGNDYLLLIWDDDAGSSNCDFCLTLQPRPINDECTGAIPYPGDVVNETCVTGYDFSTFTDSGLSPFATCDMGGDATGWFTFTAPITTAAGEPVTLEWDGFSCGIGIDVYETDCNTPLFSCLDNIDGLLPGFIQGNDYLLLLWDDGIGAGFSCDFCLTIGPQPLTNDECTDAIPYPGDVINGTCVTSFDFTQYTDSGLSPSATCDGAGDFTGWFTFTAPVTTTPGDTITLQWFTGVNCDIGVDVYETDCSTPLFSCLNNEDGLLPGFIQGNDYLLLLWDDNPPEGNCDFCLTIAQPPPLNDECAGATPYPGDVANGTCVTDYNFSQYTDSGLSPSPGCNNGDGTAWFTFTAPVTTFAGDDIDLQWDAGINCHIGIEVFDAGCGASVSNCLNNEDGYLADLAQGNDYLLVIWDDSSGGFNCDFCLTIAPPPTPGDECSAPIPYPGDIASGTCVSAFNFTGYTNTGLSPFLSCISTPEPQVWFTVTIPLTTAAGDSLNLIYDNGSCDLGIEFYSLDCNNPVSNCIVTSGDGGLITGLMQGMDYLILVHNLFGSGGPVCDFCLSLPPPNDECTGAVPYPGDVINGTCVTGYDFTPFTDSGFSPSPSCDGGGGDATAWFTFTAPVTTLAGDAITLLWDAGINCDIGIDVFDANCSASVSSCLSNFSGYLPDLVQGNDYLLVVWDNGSGSIDCDFCLSIAPPPPLNDECTGAIPYPGDVGNGGCVTGYDFSQFTDSGLSPFATCDGADATGWFTFTVPVISVPGDPITLEWDAGINCSIGIDVYETDCSTPVPFSCIDNIDGLLSNLIQGNDYLLLIWDDSNGNFSCDFCLTIIDGCTDSDACNFNPQAGNDDGSCFYVGDMCDDGNPASNNDMINDNCSCAGIFPPGCNDIISNGSFETGDFSNWIASDQNSPLFFNFFVNCGSFSADYYFDPIIPLNGNCMAVTGFDGGIGVEDFITLHQELTIPANATSADFTFSWWVAHDLYSYSNTEILFELQVLPVGGGTPLAIPYTFTAMAETLEPGTGWMDVTVDLSAFAGQTIWVYFVETISNQYVYGSALLGIDEVSLIACTPVCEEEINGAILVSDPSCDVSGIDITIMAPDGTSITVTTGVDGTFSLPGGPFPCGDYTAAFNDPASLPVCYTTTGSTGPVVFTVDGEGGGDDGPFFFANPEIPTLSQWGLILLALLMMIFGVLKLSYASVLPGSFSKG